MTTQHTPEPWAIDSTDNDIISTPGDLVVYMNGTFDSISDEDMRRIVACVNACAGIDTAFLVAWAHGVQQNNGKPWSDRIDENLSEIRALKQQHDELLALNAELAGAATHYREHSQSTLPHGHNAENRLVIAIAKAGMQHG